MSKRIDNSFCKYSTFYSVLAQKVLINNLTPDLFNQLQNTLPLKHLQYLLLEYCHRMILKLFFGCLPKHNPTNTYNN